MGESKKCLVPGCSSAPAKQADRKGEMFAATSEFLTLDPKGDDMGNHGPDRPQPLVKKES